MLYNRDTPSNSFPGKGERHWGGGSRRLICSVKLEFSKLIKNCIQEMDTKLLIETQKVRDLNYRLVFLAYQSHSVQSFILRFLHLQDHLTLHAFKSPPNTGTFIWISCMKWPYRIRGRRFKWNLRMIFSVPYCCSFCNLHRVERVKGPLMMYLNAQEKDGRLKKVRRSRKHIQCHHKSIIDLFHYTKDSICRCQSSTLRLPRTFLLHIQRPNMKSVYVFK